MNTSSADRKYIQDYMKENVCFGCGKDNAEGLQIKSYWEDNLCICEWQSEEKYQGWKNLMNGGILATLIDCHTIGTALSYAYRSENRVYDSEPVYRYATGTIHVKYLKPTPNDQPVKLIARVTDAKARKITIECTVWVNTIKTAEAEVIAIRVFNSEEAHGSNPFAQ